MPRKKDSPIGVGMTAKQMKRKKPINSDFLLDVKPLTENQEKLFDDYKKVKTSLHTEQQEQEKPLLSCIMH